MSYEKEIKILNISVEDAESKLKNLGATFKGKNRQKIYTYDLPTIYGRYLDILIQLKNPESEIKQDVAFSKLESKNIAAITASTLSAIIAFLLFCELIANNTFNSFPAY